jgi:2-dehydropantoate 2-reductase
MRYFIYGAGAVGGTVGAGLAMHGSEVVLIARGRHLEALQADGLLLRTPDGDHRIDVAAVGSPDEAKPARGDVVILTMKSQDTQAALNELAQVAEPDITVLCAQNGVGNERMALRRFARVGAACVIMPATHLEPGVVVAHSWPVTGVFEIGLYPTGVDEGIVALAAELTASGVDTQARDRVMPWKYTKLLGNLGNALDAAVGAAGRSGALYGRARAEAIACYEAGGIEWASEDAERERRSAMSPMRMVEGVTQRGSSSWQSLARGTGSIETDWLNGEIVLLGRLHGVPTPVNEALQQVANRMARDRIPAGSLSPSDIEALV